MSGEKVKMEKNRYRMLFSFENVYGIFRAKSKMDFAKSSMECELVFLDYHDCVIPSDLLLDILYFNRSGKLNLQRNDVVSVRINGCVSNFCFNGNKVTGFESALMNFYEVKGFINQERTVFLNDIHRSNKVMGVLDGYLYSIENMDINRYCFYAIDSEVFRKEGNGFIRSDYSLYKMDENGIKADNLYCRPFQMIKNALYYFSRDAKGKRKALLLLNRYELEMIMDYYQLQKMIG